MKRVFSLLLVGFCLLASSLADEVLSIGSLGEEAELILPQQMKEGPDGNIDVYDQQDGYIKVYSSRGKYLRKIGGQCQGPGEIQRIEDVSFGFPTSAGARMSEFLSPLIFPGAIIKMVWFFLPMA